MKHEIDAHGQPSNPHFNQAMRTERDISELLGLAKGIIADGIVVEAEANFVREWIDGHPQVLGHWPGNVLGARLERIYEDGRVDEAEQRDLAELLATLVGGQASILVGQDAATNLPIDQPPPSLTWKDSVFVLTGKFIFAPRAECERQVTHLGGYCDSDVTKRTNYLVIGTIGSRDWIHTSFGRKIEKAVEYRAAGQCLAIVNEDHWAAALP